MRWRADVVRYAGEWVAAVVADIARAGRGCRRAGRGRVRAAAARDRSARQAIEPAGPLVHPGARLERPLSPQVRLGAGRGGVRRARSTALAFRARWGRSSTVPIETFGVVAQLGCRHADPRRLGVDPDAQVSRPDRRARCACRATRCACTTTSTSAAATASSAASSTRCSWAISRGSSACRCASSRTGWRTCAAATCRGRTASSTCRRRSTATARSAPCASARVDDVGAYAGPLAAAARQAGRRHLRPVPHRPRSSTSRSR